MASQAIAEHPGLMDVSLVVILALTGTKEVVVVS
jgi:hypothetical protein